MSIHLNCIVCLETFKATDKVYSTTCGHIFHYHCLLKLPIQNFNCPQCREVNPGSHKIFLTFNDTKEKSNEFLELKIGLQKSRQNVIDLKYQLEQSKKALSDSQMQMKKTNDKFNIHKANCKKEIIFLRNNLQKSEDIRKSLEQNLEQVSFELKKINCRNSNCDNLSGIDSLNNDQPSTNETNHGQRSVVIRGIRRAEYQMPAVQIVLKLAKCMNLHLRKSDIDNIYLLERNCYINQDFKPEHISIVVEFNTLELKSTFLANKFKLREPPNTRNLNIYEYVSDKTNILYRYANKLKNFGYKSVYCRNNMVFAKMCNNPSIRIFNWNQVKEMMNYAASCNKFN